MNNVRKAVIAGSWYPIDPVRLKTDITKYLSDASVSDINGRVTALVVPHAGLIYSGQVAAHAYNAARGNRYDTVIVIGPSHRTRFKGVSIYNGTGYETPLGIMSVDQALSREIVANSNGTVSLVPDDRSPENSIEIQVPFLQMVLGHIPFVPVLMGTQDMGTCMALAKAIIQAVGDRRVLVIASSDFSHYHNYDKAVEMDSAALGYIEKMDIDGFRESIDSGRCEACGAGAVIVTMMIARAMKADSGKLLEYMNSGDLTGNKRGVVGYGAVAFYKNTGNSEKKQEDRMDGLTRQEQKLLLQIARTSIESEFTGGDMPNISIESAALQKKMGVFVTLKKQGQLRGCIGLIEGRKPLHETVAEMAQAAAFKDPRFHEVKQNELGELSIEISALTPLRQIDDLSEIEVGRHGIYIIKGFNSGLLLPQVATEYNWDRDTFLRETCVKAGLSQDEWKDTRTRIFIFSASVFSED
ncbi:MAG: AmmeMemoRadiSam system protein B [Thermodesulfobacteriota bacterium]|nr:AmmeMemoRadiSam system protein B [Thermodesulfobacteriota bacterium]